MSHELFGALLLVILFVVAIAPYRAYRRGWRLFHRNSAGPQPYPAPPSTETDHKRDDAP